MTGSDRSVRPAEPAEPAEVTDRAAVRRAHARLAAAMADGHPDAEDPDDPSTVRAMPLVMEFPHDPVPDRRAVLEAAATACVALCLDPRAGQDPATSSDSVFADALDRWYGARIRKIARRARNRRWRDVQDLPGVTATVVAQRPDRPHATASVRAFLPCPVSQTPALLNKLQIEGADVEPDPSYADCPEAVLDTDRQRPAPVIYVDASLGMTVGKAAAQVAHGSMLLAAAMDPGAALDWAERGFPLHVCEVGSTRFAEVRALAQRPDRSRGGSVAGDLPAAAIVQDAGYTEVVPGSVTVVALTR